MALVSRRYGTRLAFILQRLLAVEQRALAWGAWSNLAAAGLFLSVLWAPDWVVAACALPGIASFIVGSRAGARAQAARRRREAVEARHRGRLLRIAAQRAVLAAWQGATAVRSAVVLGGPVQWAKDRIYRN